MPLHSDYIVVDGFIDLPAPVLNDIDGTLIIDTYAVRPLDKQNGMLKYAKTQQLLLIQKIVKDEDGFFYFLLAGGLFKKFKNSFTVGNPIGGGKLQDAVGKQKRFGENKTTDLFNIFMGRLFHEPVQDLIETGIFQVNVRKLGVMHLTFFFQKLNRIHNSPVILP
jgi:hypothetical protein